MSDNELRGVLAMAQHALEVATELAEERMHMVKRLDRENSLLHLAAEKDLALMVQATVLVHDAKERLE